MHDIWVFSVIAVITLGMHAGVCAWERRMDRPLNRSSDA